jgi:hypothetical protein
MAVLLKQTVIKFYVQTAEAITVSNYEKVLRVMYLCVCVCVCVLGHKYSRHIRIFHLS